MNSIYSNIVAWLVFAIFFKLLLWRRKKELDENGNPVIRYLLWPYAMIIFGFVFLAISVYEWLDPVNHHYSGNLVLLSYIPLCVSLISFFMAIYTWKYQVTLHEYFIQIDNWPFKTVKHELSDLRDIKTSKKNTLLYFSNNDVLSVNIMLSGREYFLENIKH